MLPTDAVGELAQELTASWNTSLPADVLIEARDRARFVEAMSLRKRSSAFCNVCASSLRNPGLISLNVSDGVSPSASRASGLMPSKLTLLRMLSVSASPSLAT